jgi:hypothetical protein
MNRRSQRTALTALEITIVVVVVLLLGLLAVFCKRVYMVRRNIERTHLGVHAIAVAAEAYNVDWSAYPTLVENELFLPCLTTPIAYLARFPLDPSSPGGDSFFDYMSYVTQPKGPPQAFIVRAHGPDGDYDLPIHPPSATKRSQAAVFDPNAGPPSFGLPRPLATYRYDPTNGVRSDGDLFRTGGIRLP